MLKGMLTELSEGLKHVRYEQDYMLVRTSLHHRTGEHTNRVAVRSAVYVIALLFFGGIFQVWYYKRFFEIRLIVWLLPTDMAILWRGSKNEHKVNN